MPAGYIVLKIDSFSAKKRFARSIDQHLGFFWNFFENPNLTGNWFLGQKKALLKKKWYVRVTKTLAIFLKLVIIFLFLGRFSTF